MTPRGAGQGDPNAQGCTTASAFPQLCEGCQYLMGVSCIYPFFMLGVTPSQVWASLALRATKPHHCDTQHPPLSEGLGASQ